MCLIVFAVDSHPDYKLILAANRDEFYARPTEAAAFWDDAPDVLGGRDLLSGGTWLGVTRKGRIAAVTNFRDPARRVQSPLFSRGRLVADYLRGEESPADYIQHLQAIGPHCDGFNIILGDLDSLYYFSNRGGDACRMHAGIHGLSNHLLDTPWPKVVFAKERIAAMLAVDKADRDELFSLMHNSEPFPAGLLPDTGIGLEREILLSPLFIRGRDYGTRSTTLLFVDRNDTITFMEHTPSPASSKEFTIECGV